MASFWDGFQKSCSGEETATISKNHKWRKTKFIEFNYFYKPVWAAWKCVCAKRQEPIWVGVHETFDKFTSRSRLPKSCCGSEKSRGQIGPRRFSLDQWSILTFEVPFRGVHGKQNQPSKKRKCCSRIGFHCNCWHGDHPEIMSEIKKERVKSPSIRITLYKDWRGTNALRVT